MEARNNIKEKIKNFWGIERWEIEQKDNDQTTGVCVSHEHREYLIEKYKSKFPSIQNQKAEQPIRL